MSRLIFSEQAILGLERCRQFLNEVSPETAQKASLIIRTSFRRLEQSPFIGRPCPPPSSFRELVIPFGNSGYVALYSLDEDADRLIVLAFRHQREAGY